MPDVIQNSIECYRTIMHNNDLKLLEELFSQNGVSSMKHLRGSEVIGLKHPIRGVDGISESQQDDDGMIYDIQLESIAYDSKLLIDLPEDISCRFHDEPISDGESGALTRKKTPSKKAERPDVNDYLLALFELYAWTLEKTSNRFVGEIFGSMVQGVLSATIDLTKTKTNEQRDKVVNLLLDEIGQDPTEVLQLLDNEYSHRVLDCISQILYYSIPKPETELEKTGLKKLLEKAYEYAQKLQVDAISTTINHYKQLLENMNPDAIERLFNSTTDYGKPPFSFIDVVEQAIIFSKATTDWMIGPHLSNIEYQIKNEPELTERNELTDVIRELIMTGLNLAAKVVSESSECLAATIGSIIKGSRTSIWIQTFIEWESSNFLKGDTGLSDAYRHYFGRVHGALFPKPGISNLQLIESSDDQWTLYALDTLNQGFVLNGFQESANLVNEYIERYSLGSPRVAGTSLDMVEENELLRDRASQKILAEIGEYQQNLFEKLLELINKFGVPDTLKKLGERFWHERIPQDSWRRLRPGFIDALFSASLLAQIQDYKFAILTCIRAAEEELYVILEAFRNMHQFVEIGDPPSEKSYNDTFKELASFMTGGELNLRAIAFILKRIGTKEMSDRGRNIFTYFAEFVKSKGHDWELKETGNLLFSRIDGNEMIDLRNAAVHVKKQTNLFNETLWLKFLDRFDHVIGNLRIIDDFKDKETES